MNALKASRVVLSLLIAIGLGISLMMGCSEFKDSAGIDNPDMLNPKGTIAGRLIDKCTNVPVRGVKVSIAENGSTVTTDNFGEFVFKNVPVNGLTSPGGNVNTGSYVIVLDFTSYNQAFADTSALRYNNHEYVTVNLIFTDLNDGDNDGAGGDAGSGLDTPVDHLVANVELLVGKLNTQINGQVVDMNYNPVANAVVYLKKNLNYTGTWALIKQTTTDVNGNYVFTNVEAGSSVTIEAMNSTLTLSGDVDVDLTCNQNSVLRTQVSAEQLVLGYDDNISPFVTNITPVNTQDINPTGLTIVYTFSEPIKATPYTRTDLGKGHNTIMDDIIVTYVGMKKVAAAVPFEASWNTGMTQLTVTPSGIVGAARYTVNNFVSVGSTKILDNANRAVVNNAGITGDFETLNFTTTGLSTQPTAPDLLIDTVNVTPDFSGATVTLDWNVPTNVTIKEFNVYKQIGTGSFEFLATTTNSSYSDATGNLVTTGNNPLYSQTVKYYVVAISNNLVMGLPSNTFTVRDNKKPVVVDADSTGLSLDGNVYINVFFNEPISESTAEVIGQYQISNLGNNTVVTTVSEAVYIGKITSGVHNNTYAVRIKVNPNSMIYGTDEVQVFTNVYDLSGNSINTNNSQNRALIGQNP